MVFGSSKHCLSPDWYKRTINLIKRLHSAGKLSWSAVKPNERLIYWGINVCHHMATHTFQTPVWFNPTNHWVYVIIVPCFTMVLRGLEWYTWHGFHMWKQCVCCQEINGKIRNGHWERSVPPVSCMLHKNKGKSSDDDVSDDGDHIWEWQL